MLQRWGKVWFWIVLLMSAPCLPSEAGLIVNTSDLGGGLFEYDLTIENTDLINPTTGLPEPISGLNILNGNSVFGLDFLSDISAPAGWLFFAPDRGPPLINELNFFSLTADVPIGSSLGGFSFKSTEDPANLHGNDFAHDFIGGITGDQIPPVPVPEPGTFGVLAIAGLIACLLTIRRRRNVQRASF